VRLLSRLLLALTLMLALAPALARAQDPGWREQRTDRFAILYASGDEAVAQEYAGFVDTIYDEVSSIFGHKTSTPVTLRLFQSMERYYEVNPLARNMPGIVAHADFRRHELVVIVPQTRSQTADEVQNNIRHELTHIVLAELTEDRLNVGFHEGIAQYIEHPSGELERKIPLLQQALDDELLLTWAEMDDRDVVYKQPQVSYPQSLSMAAFLVERFSFGKLREFLTISARSSGYRSALDRAYGMSPDDLEQEWLAWLPSYLEGGYRRNALTAYDLSRAEDLLARGRYPEAQEELETAIDWLRETGQQEVLDEAEVLLERSVEGQRADGLAEEARSSLAAGDYENAAYWIEQARHAYERIGDRRQLAVLDAYAARIAQGRRADEVLAGARELANQLRYPQARELVDEAMAQYDELGYHGGAAQARELRAFLDQRQTVFGLVVLLLGVGGIAASVLGRLAARELEAW
jgi:tetratricopeptide (TPR) repeat protein